MNVYKFFRLSFCNYCFQRLVTWYPLRKLMTGMVLFFVPGYQKKLTDEDLELSRIIGDHGYAPLPNFLSPGAVEKIFRHLDGRSLIERFGERRRGFDLKTVPKNVHVAEYEVSDILNCPEVVSIANNENLIGAAAAYLRCKPTISNINIWWSFPASGPPQEAENYHRDVDDWKFVKFFLYLTDVDEDNGPHCFVRGSHKTSNFLRIKRIKDSEVFSKFPKSSELMIGGKSGDGFLEDTFGLHKGRQPVKASRLVLQVEYSVFPIGVYRYNPINLVTSSNIDPYINRLYFKKS